MELVLLGVIAIVVFAFWATIKHSAIAVDKMALRKLQRLEAEQIAMDIDYYSKNTIDIKKATDAATKKAAILALPL